MNGSSSKTIFICNHIEPSPPLTSKRINNCIHYTVWDEITYPFPNFNGDTIEVWEWISNFNPHFIWHVITYPCWNVDLIHVSKRGCSHVSTNGLGIKTVFICIHIKLSQAFVGKRITGFSQQSNIRPSTLLLYSSGDMSLAINTWKIQYLFAKCNFTLQYCSL